MLGENKCFYSENIQYTNGLRSFNLFSTANQLVFRIFMKHYVLIMQRLKVLAQETITFALQNMELTHLTGKNKMNLT